MADATAVGRPLRFAAARPAVRAGWFAGALVFAGCGEADAPPQDGAVERPNPAADFCVAQGGEYSIADRTCGLPDGTVVDAWEYFRQHHPQLHPQ